MDAGPNILIMTPVTAEMDAVCRGLQNNPRFHVTEAGVGPAEAAVRTTLALTRGSFDLVICMGIAGGFPGRAAVGSLVVADAIVAADLGAETPDGFSSLDTLGFGSSTIEASGQASALATALAQAGLAAALAPILTLSTVTGTAATAQALSERFPRAAAEAMEGFGVATAAQSFGIPVLEIRAISNAIGPRDRSAWRIGEALQALEAAGPTLLEVLV
ncbi:futalosine hydrolase [Paenibacillus algorifonticola]|uniref:Futalosine hydrolase n=1 Tax=Paenibacillus algorifonticola TaxID=684063 RepID=A0A1I2D8A6_9BACL|nr:futalosine hydrolase [Paenibacillus algorifonticola]SFE76776.1 futalosine hydrolase [Paenibacillus algorifonticola]